MTFTKTTKRILVSGLMIPAAFSMLLSNNNVPKTNPEPAAPEPVPTLLSVDTVLSDAFNCLPDVLAINAEGMPKPPAKFRQGHVTVKNYKAPVTRIKYGFKIKLPANTRVPTPTVKNGKIYSGGGFGSRSFYCFNAENGATEWAVDLDDDGPSTPVYRDGRIVFNTESCTIFALDAETGKPLWSHWLGDPLMATPTIANGRVYTTYPAYYDAEQLRDKGYSIHPNHPLICMDLYTGEILWQQWLDGDIISKAVVNNGELYLTTFPGTLYKLNAESGKILAAKSMRATSAPIIEDGLVHVTRRIDKSNAVSEGIAMLKTDELGYIKDYNETEAPYLDKQIQMRSALRSQSMEEDAGNGFSGGAPASSGWESAAENVGQSNVSSLQAFRGSEIMRSRGRSYNTMGNKIVCTDDRSGAVLWEQRIEGNMRDEGGYLSAPPLTIGENIFFISLNGTLKLSDAKTGEEKLAYALNTTIREQAVYKNGWIYVPTTAGEILCLDLDKIIEAETLK